jgi:hypothetical protein
MDPLSSNVDPFSDEATQKDASEWLRTTDVLDQDFKRSRSSDEAATSSSARRPNKFRRQSSLDYVLSDEEMVGISISTFLRGAAGQLGEESSTKSHNTHNNSGSQLSTSHQPVNALNATKPASMIDLTTEDAVSQPSTSAHVSISSTSPHYDHLDKGVNSDQMQSSVASTGTGARALRDLSSRDFICNRQKMSHQYPRQTSESLLEPIPINKWRKTNHQDSQMTGPAEPSHGSSSPISFFRNMSEHSSQFLRMMSISSATPHEEVSTNSMSGSGSAIMSDTSSYNELEGAMAQTRQSRQMVMGAFSGITRNDSSNSSATVATTARNMPEFRLQNRQIDMVDPAQRAPVSSDVNRTSPGLSVAEAKRSLEQIAKEQMILEKRLAQLQREGFSR